MSARRTTPSSISIGTSQWMRIPSRISPAGSVARVALVTMDLLHVDGGIGVCAYGVGSGDRPVPLRGTHGSLVPATAGLHGRASAFQNAEQPDGPPDRDVGQPEARHAGKFARPGR